MSYPIPSNESDRLRYLAELDVDFDTPIPELQGLCDLAAEIAGTPVSLVSLVGDDDQRFAANTGLDGVTGTPRDVAFCAHAIMSSEQFVVADATRDPRFAENPLVTGSPDIRAYAGTVLEPDGERVGTLCVIDTRPREFSPEVLQRLNVLGRAVSALLQASRDTRRLQKVAQLERRRTAEVRRIAESDGLTGLLNRSAFRDRVASRLSDGDLAALVLIDADNFKMVNDRFGHPVGDEFLRAIARGVTSALPRGGLAARLGGDEFAAFLPALDTDLTQRFGAIQQSVADELFRVRPDIAASVSVGAALYPRHGVLFDDLYRSADIALYSAKRGGRDRVHLYRPGMDPVENLRLLRIELDEALPAGDISAWFQPVIDLKRSGIFAFESLVRWNHSKHGMLSPAQFAPILLDRDAGQLVTRHMLGECVDFLNAIPAVGESSLRVALNLTDHDLLSEGFIDFVDRTLSDAGQSWDRLIFEISEGAVLDQAGSQGIDTIHTLRERGTLIALDDFGTGHATLTHLRNWPIDILKIDKTFTSALRDDPRDASIVAAIVGLARDLGIAVICEGIEGSDQAATVLGMGCTLGQGYAFSPALPAKDAITFLRDGAETVRVA